MVAPLGLGVVAVANSSVGRFAVELYSLRRRFLAMSWAHARKPGRIPDEPFSCKSAFRFRQNNRGSAGGEACGLGCVRRFRASRRQERVDFGRTTPEPRQNPICPGSPRRGCCLHGRRLREVYWQAGRVRQLITGPYHLLSVADTARRAALSRRGVAHLSFPIDVQPKRLADDDESLGADVQHGMASSWVPQIEMPPPDAVRAAADLLNAGRRTVLLVG